MKGVSLMLGGTAATALIACGNILSGVEGPTADPTDAASEAGAQADAAPLATPPSDGGASTDASGSCAAPFAGTPPSPCGTCEGGDICCSVDGGAACRSSCPEQEIECTAPSGCWQEPASCCVRGGGAVCSTEGCPLDRLCARSEDCPSGERCVAFTTWGGTYGRCQKC